MVTHSKKHSKQDIYDIAPPPPPPAFTLPKDPRANKPAVAGTTPPATTTLNTSSTTSPVDVGGGGGSNALRGQLHSQLQQQAVGGTSNHATTATATATANGGRQVSPKSPTVAAAATGVGFFLPKKTPIARLSPIAQAEAELRKHDSAWKSVAAKSTTTAEQQQANNNGTTSPTTAGGTTGTAIVSPRDRVWSKYLSNAAAAAGASATNNNNTGATTNTAADNNNNLPRSVSLGAAQTQQYNRTASGLLASGVVSPRIQARAFSTGINGMLGGGGYSVGGYLMDLNTMNNPTTYNGLVNQVNSAAQQHLQRLQQHQQMIRIDGNYRYRMRSEGRCFVCGELGHLGTQCPLKP